MPTIPVSDAKKQLASGKPSTVYVLTGPDEREKSELASRFGDLVEPELRAFNVERVYGADTTAPAIVDAARTLPMMADRRVVVVLQADRLLNPKKRGEDGEEGGGDLEVLVDYLASPEAQTVLVFVLPPPEPGGDARRTHDLLPLPGNTRITKALARVAAVVPCGEFGSTGEAVRWLEARAREAGLSVDRAATKRIVEIAAGDPAKFKADVERVLTFAAGEDRVTLDHVEEAIVAHEVSRDDWAIVRALEGRQPAAALRELRMRLEAGDTAYGILGQIGYAVRTPPPRGRFPPDRLPAAIDAIFRTDVALKSSGGDPRVLLERLIVELCG
jgi:DNA polymerase-3 subunit delta